MPMNSLRRLTALKKFQRHAITAAAVLQKALRYGGEPTTTARSLVSVVITYGATKTKVKASPGVEGYRRPR